MLASKNPGGYAEVFVRHVAAKAGKDYGERVQSTVYDLLKPNIPKEERV